MQAYFLVVYDRQSGAVVDFHDNKSESLHRLYLQHTPYFHAACMDNLWTRYITPCPASLHLPSPADAPVQGHSQSSHNQVRMGPCNHAFAQQHAAIKVCAIKSMPHCGAQMVRRVLANLPAMAQALSPSPFLDYNLFSYDDKLISPVLRMRAYSEQPLKFSSRAHPTGYRFKVTHHCCPALECPAFGSHHAHPQYRAQNILC